MKYWYSKTLLIQFYFSPSFNLSLQSIFHEMISFLQTPLSMAPVVRGGHQRIAIDIAVPEVEDTVHWNEQPVFGHEPCPLRSLFSLADVPIQPFLKPRSMPKAKRTPTLLSSTSNPVPATV